MKKIIILLALSLAFLTSAFGKTPDFTGTWTLDLEKSKDVKTFYPTVKSHTLFIKQDKKHLTIAAEIDAGRAAPDKLDFIYNLDGSETKSEIMIRTPNGPVSVPTVLKAVPLENERLQTEISREQRMGEKTMKWTTVEIWQLSADGKTLTIYRKDDTPRGKMEGEYVFVKK